VLSFKILINILFSFSAPFFGLCQSADPYQFFSLEYASDRSSFSDPTPAFYHFGSVFLSEIQTYQYPYLTCYLSWQFRIWQQTEDFDKLNSGHYWLNPSFLLGIKAVPAIVYINMKHLLCHMTKLSILCRKRIREIK